MDILETFKKVHGTKRIGDEATAVKTDFDPIEAQRLFTTALRRLGAACPKGCTKWAKENRPDLLVTVSFMETQYSLAYEAGDMVGVRKAVEGFESVWHAIFNAHHA